MDPVTIVAATVAVASIGALLKPLFDVVRRYYLHRRADRNIRISVSAADGTVKSIEVPITISEQVTEEQIKRLIELLVEADDGTKSSPSKE